MTQTLQSLGKSVRALNASECSAQPARAARSVHEGGEATTCALQTLVGRLGDREVFEQTLAHRLDVGLVARRHEIKQTVERVLDLPADHVDVGDGKLRVHIVRLVGGNGTHHAHVRIGGTGQQQRLRTFAGGARIVRIGFKTFSYAAAAPA